MFSTLYSFSLVTETHADHHDAYLLVFHPNFFLYTRIIAEGDKFANVEDQSIGCVMNHFYAQETNGDIFIRK